MLAQPSRTRYDLVFPIFGIPVRVHPLFWLIAAVLGWHEGRMGVTLVAAACIFVSILVHECGHAFAARRFGAHNIRIILYGMGGLAISQGRRTRRQRIIELLAGPGAGFALLVLAVIVGVLLGPEGRRGYTGVALYFLIRINLIWGLVNLLPVFPLDGGQIAREIIVARRPYDGLLLTFRFSMIAAVTIAVIFFILMLLGVGSWFFAILIFGLLAYMNHQLSQPRNLSGFAEGDYGSQSSPWEQDSDWWKK